MNDRTAIIKAYVPPYLREAEPMNSIFAAAGAETGNLFDSIEDVLKQMYVTTATWGLAIWESFLGLETDESDTDANRRSVINSKLRGVGTFTQAMVLNAAESFENGTVEITEYPKLGYFKIKFVSTRGLPPNFSAFQTWIEDIKPAHLGAEYEFVYMTFAEFDAYNKTWDQWDALNLTWDEFELYEG